MSEINFVNFAKYIIMKNATTKKNFVTSIINRTEYDPGRDFYKKIRDTLKRVLKNHLPLTELDTLAENVCLNKKNCYSVLASGIHSLLDNANYTWVSPVRARVNYSGLDIIVNPEIGLNINGTLHFIKIHFNKRPINAQVLTIMNKIMQDTYKDEYPNITFTVWDIQNLQMHSVSSTDNIPLAYNLEQEAEIWLQDEKDNSD